MRYCHKCGNKVSESDNFCSKCGVRLISLKEEEISVVQTLVKICDLCGEENSLDDNECSYCGVGFTGKEKIIKRKIDTTYHYSPQRTNVDIKHKSQENKKRNAQKNKKYANKVEQQFTGKKLELKYLIYGGLIILAIGFLLIYSSSKNSTSPNIQNQNNQTGLQSRINLNAISEINKLEIELKNDPNNQQKLLKLANLTHDAGFFEKAINYYDKYLKLNPNDNDAEVDMGVCYFELRQFDKASNIFENVIKKNPQHQIAYLNLGVVNLSMGNVERAKELFKQCINLGQNTDAGLRAAELLKSH